VGFLSCFSSLQVYEKVRKHSHLVYMCACVDKEHCWCIKFLFLCIRERKLSGCTKPY
jgi:hypothetical protein